ncbi:MAG: glycosyltransferase, partial [Acidimicrobiales bacterium]
WTTDWLYVGRIVGNKCQHDLVKAFSYYAKAFDGDARLILVGDTSVSGYVEEVKDVAHRLGVADRVVMLGKVSDSQLISAYAGVGVFVSMSEHEGFGVPILEAMASGVPVVAFGAAAVPEVMGGAGILLRHKDPKMVAATVQSLREDPDFRRKLVERQFVRVEQVQRFDVPALLNRVIHRAAGHHQPLEVQVQGPFETSYSLAVINREIACGLDDIQDRAVSIYATEGPGDYVPDPINLRKHPRATALMNRSLEVPYPHVVMRQMWPPRVIDSPGGITVEYFGWEESRIPKTMVDDFNRYLNGVGVMSNFVKDVLRDSGVDVPIRVTGIGVAPHDESATISAPELEDLRGTRFLHISSAFPRKGVDILLDAYFAAFSGSDDVSLILKTFPNPHNQVESILSGLRAKHLNPPDVRWIDRDLFDHDVMALYNLASCYVHPARGEGFGLPVAEAMVAGVPVITLAYSGLADFVSEDTATLIGYDLQPAQTHFNVPNSVWAEPDRGQLAIEMRRMFDEPDRLEVKEKLGRARDLITSEFSWENVSRRWDEFLAELETASAKPHVAMISTWNSKCGIAENTRSIVEHLGGSAVVDIYADKEAQIIDPIQEFGVQRLWIHRWKPDLAELEDALRLSDSDVLHLQFNFGFFELERLGGLIERQLEQRAVVLTLHRTTDIEIEGEMVSLRSIKPTLERVDRLIVHQDRDAEELAEMGITDNVEIVPIGTADPPSISPSEARELLGLGDRPVIGTFGFLLPHKGTLDLIRIVDSLRPEFPDICLLALCARYPDVTSVEYEELVRNEIQARGLSKNVLLVTDYLSEEVSRAMLRGVDAIVLPYSATAESSSAALRFVLPAERPLIVTDLPIFADCRDAVYAVDPSDPVWLEDAIRRVLVDGEFREQLAGRASDAARKYRWSRAVADHRAIYGMAKKAHEKRSSPFRKRAS